MLETELVKRMPAPERCTGKNSKNDVTYSLFYSDAVTDILIISRVRLTQRPHQTFAGRIRCPGCSESCNSKTFQFFLFLDSTRFLSCLF